MLTSIGGCEAFLAVPMDPDPAGAAFFTGPADALLPAAAFTVLPDAAAAVALPVTGL